MLRSSSILAESADIRQVLAKTRGMERTGVNRIMTVRFAFMVLVAG